MTTASSSHRLTPSPSQRLALPTHGARNPGAEPSATTPGSFALAPDIGGPRMFASPDTPGMPAPSTNTAWDFLPDGWSVTRLDGPSTPEGGHSTAP